MKNTIPIQFIMEMENIAPNRMYERYGIEYASTFLQKMTGLMFRKDFKGKMVFRFSRSCSIFVHTFFMRFDIRINFYSENRLIKACNMKPWQIVTIRNVDCFTEEKMSFDTSEKP